MGAAIVEGLGFVWRRLWSEAGGRSECGAGFWVGTEVGEAVGCSWGVGSGLERERRGARAAFGAGGSGAGAWGGPGVVAGSCWAACGTERRGVLTGL